MQLTYEKITKPDAAQILSWHYEAPYDFYNNACTEEAINELVSEAYYTVHDATLGLIGFFCIGTTAQVPNDTYSYSRAYLDIGLGMKPAFTGKGQGTSFITDILDFVNDMYGNRPKRLTVAKFNQRAIHLYEKMGFEKEAEFRKGSTPFITMLKAQ